MQTTLHFNDGDTSIFWGRTFSFNNIQIGSTNNEVHVHSDVYNESMNKRIFISR